jgi:predicted nuclease of predicted toxin-antitoxin system
MKILLDEMYSGLKEYLEVLDWEVTTVKESGIAGSMDREVVQYAGENDLILITQDQKPAELAELLGIKYVYISNAIIAKMADEEIKDKYGK